MSRPVVALTTTRERGQQIIDMVFDRGCDPVLMPCIEVVAAGESVLDEARRAAAQGEWLIVTSVRVITTLWPGGGMPETPVGAVGAKTAQAIQAAGGIVEVVGYEGARALVELLGDRVAGKQVVFPHAVGANPAILDELRSRGAIVQASTVYETRPLPPGNDLVDAVLFGSPSAVAGWCTSRDLDGVVIAALGPTTAEALAERGHPPHVVASRPDYEVLIDAVSEHLSDRSPA